MSKPSNPMLLGTIIFEARIEHNTVKYIALKIDSLWDRSRWHILVGKGKDRGEHSIVFTYKLSDSDDPDLLTAEVRQLLKKLLQAHYYSNMRNKGLIVCTITDDVSPP